mgnify:CR=1 FL=1
MRPLHMNEQAMITGGESTFESIFSYFGSMFANFTYDAAYNDHSKMVYQAGVNGNSQKIRDMYPNDPLL